MSETTTLPSFVQLMASLGLDKDPSPSPRTHSRSSSTSSSSSSHRRHSLTILRTHSRSSSINSQQEAEKPLGTTRRVARYVPYTPAISSTKRGSLSAIIADRDPERQTRSHPSSPLPSSRFPCLPIPDLTTPDRDYPSESLGKDLPPISIYARRRTPQTSPVASTFPRPSPDELSPYMPIPFTLPTLPALLLFDRDASISGSPSTSADPLSEVSEAMPIIQQHFQNIVLIGPPVA